MTVESHDGTLASLTIAPAGTVAWSGLEAPAKKLELALDARLGGTKSYTGVAERHQPVAGLHGSTPYRFKSHDLLDASGFDATAFEPETDGAERTRTVTLRLRATVRGTGGRTLTSRTVTATFAVTVVDRPEQVDVAGDANTGGSAGGGGATGESQDDNGPEGDNGKNEGKGQQAGTGSDDTEDTDDEKKTAGSGENDERSGGTTEGESRTAAVRPATNVMTAVTAPARRMGQRATAMRTDPRTRGHRPRERP
ncbi:hypothetical protein ACFQH6_05925 [Halobacteriaceae archaeon GCM10025711]